MDSHTKKEIGLIILVVGFIVFVGICINDYLNKTNKMSAVKKEQTQENIKIAEKMLEKELNVSSKYFKMVGKQVILFAPEEVELNTNKEASWIEWIDNDLTCEVQVNGENYSVIFETHKVDSKNEEIEMYEPVKINKIIKEQK